MKIFRSLILSLSLTFLGTNFVAFAQEASPLDRAAVLRQVTKLRSGLTDDVARHQAEQEAVQILHDLALKDIASGHSGLALEALSDIHPRYWTDPLVLEPLQSIGERLGQIDIVPAEETEVVRALDHSLVQRLINSAESQDPKMRAITAAIYLRAFLVELSNGRLDKAMVWHKAYRERKPGETKFRQMMLDRAPTAGIRKWVRRLEGLSPVEWGKILFFPGLIALLAGAGFTGRKIYQEYLRRTAKRGYKSLPSTPDEYTRLLAYFSLDDGASEAEVHAAYRALVKAFHPDSRAKSGLQPLSFKDSEEKFIEMKRNYDRLLEIRKSFFQ